MLGDPVLFGTGVSELEEAGVLCQSPDPDHSGDHGAADDWASDHWVADGWITDDWVADGWIADDWVADGWAEDHWAGAAVHCGGFEEGPEG